MTRQSLADRVATEFPKHVANHAMTIDLDNGVHRSILFKQHGTFNRYFRIVTYPGELVITGDMSTFVFSRLPDMFEFFRKDTDRRIDYSYWGSKLVAVSQSGGWKVFDPDTFRENVLYQFNSWADGDTPAIVVAKREALNDEVLSYADDGAHEAYRAAINFEYEGERPLSDFYESDCDVYSYHFLWCCHAIVWAIAQYDARQPGFVATRVSEHTQ